MCTCLSDPNSSLCLGAGIQDQYSSHFDDEKRNIPSPLHIEHEPIIHR